MLKLQELTPEIYTKQSRDFQLLSRLYDVVLNYVKTNTANLYNLPVEKNMDQQLLNLLALTLGFKPTRNYNAKQLLAICSVLPSILKHKGSLQAIVIATNALLAAEEISQPLDYTNETGTKITLFVSQQLADLSLLEDLLKYILPAGVSCELIHVLQTTQTVNTTIAMSDSVVIYKDKDEKFSHVALPESKLSLGAVGDAESILSNITILKMEETSNEN